MRFWFQEKSCELAYIDGDEIITWDIAASVVITRNRPGPPKRRRSDRPLSTTNQFFFDAFSTFIVAPDGRSAIYQGKEIYQDDKRGHGYSYSAGWWDFDRQQAQKIEPDWSLGVSFAPDGRHVAINRYYSATIFDVAKRTPLTVYRQAINRKVRAFSPEGHTLAMADTDSTNVISLTDTGLYHDLYHGIPVSAGLVAIQPDKKHLTTVSSGGKVAVYSIENRNPEPIVARSSVDDQSNEKRVESLSPNGLYYAFTDDRAQQVRLLDVSSPPASEVPLAGNL